MLNFYDKVEVVNSLNNSFDYNMNLLLDTDGSFEFSSRAATAALDASMISAKNVNSRFMATNTTMDTKDQSVIVRSGKHRIATTAKELSITKQQRSYRYNDTSNRYGTSHFKNT